MKDITTVIIAEREFIIDMNQSKDDVILKALTKAFMEIDELKEKNRTLNDKINSIKKIK